MIQLLYALLAAGTALTNSTAETLLASHELPAASMQAGKVYDIDAVVIATATNSTDTLLVNVRIGPTTLTGTIVGAAAATDVADNNVVIVKLKAVVRSVSAAGLATIAVFGLVSLHGAEGTGTARAAYEILTSVNTLVTQRIEVTGTWSVASTSNSCRADALVVTELV